LQILGLNSLEDSRTGHIDSEVKIAKVDLHVVVFDLVRAVLSAALALVSLSINEGQLLLPFLDILGQRASRQMAVHEDEGRVFEAEAEGQSAFVASSVTGGWLDIAESDVEDARLDLSFRDQQNVQTVVVELAHERVLGLGRVGVQLCHNVILHELEPIFVFIEHARAFIRHDLLDAHDENVRQVLRPLHIRQEPSAQILLIVWFHSTHVP